MSNRWSTGHIAVLDGLRGCAILAVMFFHFLSPGISGRATGFAGGIQTVIENGWCGVNLFFVLSGFLITGILLDAKDASGSYFRSFYVRRVLRIFPLYYGIILAIAIGRHVPAVNRVFAFDGIQASLGWLFLFLANFVMAWQHNNQAFGSLGHFWTLAVEEHFYVVWPAVVWFCSRRVLARVCLCLVAGACLLRCAILLHPSAFGMYDAYLLTPCNVDALALGALLALIVRSDVDVGRVREVAGILVIICAIALVAGEFAGGSTGNRYGRAHMAFKYSVLAALFTSVIALSASASAHSPGRRLLEWGPLMSVGKYSYAMYILHQIFLPPFVLLFPSSRLGIILHSANLGIYCFAILAATGSYLLGWLSWNLLEKHFLKLKRFFPY